MICPSAINPMDAQALADDCPSGGEPTLEERRWWVEAASPACQVPDEMFTHFGELAPRLHDLGYQPVPIKPGGKAPMLPGWQQPQHPDHFLPWRNPRTGEVIDCARWGIGVQSRTTPGIDLDLRSQPLVDLLIELADDMIGAAPVRYGAAPKALLPFQTKEPFDKLTSGWFALPGEDFRAEGYTPHRIEVLGVGQQFVAYAIHPNTGRPYVWERGALTGQHRIDLPHLDAAAALRFVQGAERIMVAAGCTALLRDGSSWRPCSGSGRARQQERIDTAALNCAEVGHIARCVDPHASYSGSGWRARCPVHQGVSHTSLALREENGTLLWHCFGGCTQAEVGRALQELVQ